MMQPNNENKDKILKNVWKISRLHSMNKKSLLDFRYEVALTHLQILFESEELVRNKLSSGRCTKSSIQKLFMEKVCII